MLSPGKLLPDPLDFLALCTLYLTPETTFKKGDGHMQRYEQICGIMSRPRAFVPLAGTLTVNSGGGLNGRSVPISLAACSCKP